MNGSGGPPAAAVVTVGDELLLGRTVDANAAWLGRELADLGVPVAARYTVGDDDAQIVRAVERALADAEVVLVTGGLGPTRDDRTREAVAGWLGLPLRTDPALLAALEARFRARGYDRLPERNVTQAQVPEGATVLGNPLGTAPGLALDVHGGLLVLLPGVPREMEAIVAGELRALLERRLGPRLRPLHHRSIHTTGIAESDLAGRVEALLPSELGPVTLAFLPHTGGVDLRLTARGVDGKEAEGWLDRIESALAPALEGFRFEAAGGDLTEAVAGRLVAAGRRLAVAESCTGGLVGKRLTDRAGASGWFVGGVVAYADRVKVEALGVDADALARHGAVSEEVALQMARGAAVRFSAEAAVAVTGVAGPGGGTAEKPVGTVWYAVRVDGRAVARKEVFPGDRAAVRERSAQAALALLLRMLEGRA